MISGDLPTAIVETRETDEQKMPKLCGFEFWEKTLKGAKKIVAPMVDQSELAWRLLSRRHGAELCYTPMLNAKIFLEHRGYREREFQTHPDDHPLIAQFCGNDPQTILKAAKMVENEVEAIDLNLGCPQNIAKKGHYGSYLQDEWNLIRDIVQSMDRNLSVPVTVKIRVFDDIEKSIKYAQMIQDSGAQLLTIHGRIREQRGHNTGLADWNKIRILKESLRIPVFANGNILFKDDIDKCLAATGAEGVMTAEANLYNPCIFEDKLPLIWDMVEEYLQICKTEAPDTPLTAVRGHLFKMYRPALGDLITHRTLLGEAKTFEELCRISGEMNEILKLKYDPTLATPLNISTATRLPVVSYYCQPYIRDFDLFAMSRPDSCLTGSCASEVTKEADIDSGRPAKMIKVEDDN